jgi:hypothetical protein
MSEYEDFIDDELTEEDLSFLNKWENAGHDAKEHERLETIGDGTPEGETDPDAEIEIHGDVSEDGEGEPIESGESDEIDESKMDISQADDGTEEMDDPGSGDEGGDEPSEDELGDYSDADDDELQGDENDSEDYSPEQTEHDHLEGGDSPDEIPEGEDDLEYDDLTDDDEITSEEDDQMSEGPDDDNFTDGDNAQVEDEFEGDERGNTESEIEDLEEYEKEREEHEQELNADAEDDYEGDAQQELEDHLDNSKDDNGVDDKPEDEADEDRSDSHGKNDSSDESEPEAEENQEREELTEAPDENQVEGEEQDSGLFGNLPEAGDRCTNHCEDNPPEDDDDEMCPHCTERIRKERELHGVIGTDMHDKDIFPGDKLHVRVPIAMIAKDAIVTVNVPNQEVDPIRLAENLSHKTDIERCWLSGRGISQFTGWRMTEVGNAIWTFKKGQKITFAEKIAQPEFDDLDPEQMLDQLQQELDNYGQENKDDESEPEEEGSDEGTDEEADDEQSDNDDESEGTEENLPEDLGEHRERRKKDELTQTQKDRFENLTERIAKKIVNTFGGTCEFETLYEMDDSGTKVVRGMRVISRGMTFDVDFHGKRYDAEEDGQIDDDEVA